MKIVPLLVRVALTTWLLVLVYRGSTVALVVILALICIALELAQLATKWEKDIR